MQNGKPRGPEQVFFLPSSPISLDSNDPSLFDLLCFHLHLLTGGIKHSLQEVGEEKKIPTWTPAPQDFPLMCWGDTQLGSELVGRPLPTEGKFLATELFSFGWVPPQRNRREALGEGGQEPGWLPWILPLGGNGGFTKCEKKPTYKQGRGSNIPHVCLGPG